MAVNGNAIIKLGGIGMNQKKVSVAFWQAAGKLKNYAGISKASRRIGGMASIAFMWLQGKALAYAAEENPFGFVEQDGNGMFDDLITTVNSTGASANRLMIALGAVSVVVALGGVGLMIMLIKNSNKREENKSWLMAIVAGAMLLFGAASFAGILYNMGQSI